MKTTRRLNQTGFTLVEIMIVVAIIGLLSAIAIPNYMHSRALAQANGCISNLKEIDAAVALFAMETGKKTGDPINYPDDLKPYIKLNSSNSIPGCPAGGSYAEPAVGANPMCSLGRTVTPPHVLP
jgi:prepilin-type N-terminal cleavage/methylation domain-containing protein